MKHLHFDRIRVKETYYQGYFQRNINLLLTFIITIHTNTYHLLKFSNVRLNTTLGILLTLYNTCKLINTLNMSIEW